MNLVRVLYVDHTAKLGGGEIALLNLVCSLDRSKVEPVILLFEDGPLAARLRPVAEVHLLELSSAVSATRKDALGWRSFLKLNAVWSTLRQVLRVARLARSLRIDLVHTNSLKADLIGGLAGRLASIPVIWHVRDRIDADYLPRPVVRVFRLLCRSIPRYVIANSAATLATLGMSGRPATAAETPRLALETSSGPAPMLPHSDRCGVIHGGVIHDGCELRRLPIATASAKPGPRIGLVGRISPWKGQHIFLKAAAQVLERHPEARFELIGAALFAEVEYEQQLHELCRTLHIEHAVTFVGFVDDVPQKIAELDLLVHASTTGEPFGQVIIEAMAEAKPVIATNGGGVPEIVVDGVTGLLVSMGDVTQMANAMDDLLQHPDAAREMGRCGRERVLQHFTIQRTARRIEGLYEQLLSKSGRIEAQAWTEPEGSRT